VIDQGRSAPAPAVSRPRAFWIVEPGHGEIRDEQVALPQSDEVLIRALFSGISRGTESLVFRGCVPRSEWQRMRAPFQAGNFPAPVKYGYSMVGRVERGGPDLLGKTVFVLYPHQTTFVVPAAAVYVVPDDVPAARAVLAANLETAVNALWDARPHIGDRISLVGAGVVGCLIASLASRIVGCEVELIDVNPHRAHVAAALGVAFAQPSSARDERDLIIHASGSPAGLELSLRLAAYEAHIVDVSWYGDQAVSLPLGGAFHARRLTIGSSQVGSVATTQRARWDYRRRMQLAMRLLANDALDALITGESRFDDLPEAMAELATNPGDTLCHRIRYD
jgi:2-desacetyl-2-hydroxyethyl bacteriochlorophyllide A dehydrogenase